MMVPSPPVEALSASVPDGLLACGFAPAGSLAHVGVADVEVGYRHVPVFQAKELAHEVVVDDVAGAPHRREAEGVGRELHVLDGGGAGRVVLQGLDLIAPRGGDHSDDHGRPESFLALAADPATRHLLVLALSLGLQAGRLGPRPRQLAASLARKHVEAPRLGDLVVGGMHGALQDALYKVLRHGVLAYAPYALARLYGLDHIQESSSRISLTGLILSGFGAAGSEENSYDGAGKQVE